MDSGKFLKEVFDTGEASDMDMVKFMLQEYFLKGLNLNDFQEDLIYKYYTSEDYARDLARDFHNRLEKFIR
jgi:hypothetical protein